MENIKEKCIWYENEYELEIILKLSQNRHTHNFHVTNTVKTESLHEKANIVSGVALVFFMQC